MTKSRTCSFSIWYLAMLLAISGCSVPQAGGRAAAAPQTAIAPTTALRVPAPTVAVPAAKPILPSLDSHPTANAASVSPAQSEAVSWRTALSHTAYAKSVPTPLLFKVDFSTADNIPSNRPALNIALVLDRSASMSDDMKFSHAIAAARAVIENLTDRDTVSLIAFNENVLVLSPAGRVVNKPFLFQRLSEVEPDGITDLSAGLLEGIAQVNSQATDG